MPSDPQHLFKDADTGDILGAMYFNSFDELVLRESTNDNEATLQNDGTFTADGFDPQSSLGFPSYNSDGNAPNGTIFRNGSDSFLKFKDGSGSVYVIGDGGNTYTDTDAVGAVDGEVDNAATSVAGLDDAVAGISTYSDSEAVSAVDGEVGNAATSVASLDDAVAGKAESTAVSSIQSSSDVNHDSTAGGTDADAHHTKYTDSEAVSAVDGSQFSDLTFDVNPDEEQLENGIKYSGDQTYSSYTSNISGTSQTVWRIKCHDGDKGKMQLADSGDVSINGTLDENTSI